MDTAKGMHLSSWSVAKTTGGQGVYREVESERFAEKCRAVIVNEAIWKELLENDILLVHPGEANAPLRAFIGK